MANHHPTDNPDRHLVPVQPTHILDPYPERPPRETGVRQHTPPHQPTTWTSEPDVAELAPLPFGEWVEPDTPTARRRLYPWASTGFYAIGQLILTALIALRAIDPLLGVVVSVIWLVCGLVLIATQVMSQRMAEGYDR